VLRFLLVIVTSAIALPVLCSVHAAQVKSVHFYIALDGNDSWSGELPAPNKSGADGPFASLQRARDEVRSLRKKGHLRDIPVTVTLRGGRYRVTDTLSLTEEDSGSEKAPMVYQAMPGEHARLIGGVSLTGFTPVTDPAILARLDPQARCKALQVDLKSLGVSDFGQPAPVGGPKAELICNSKYMPLARYPNENQWMTITGIPEGGTKYETDRGAHYGRFTYEGDRAARWKNTSDLWVHGYWVHDWSDQYQHVRKLDLDKREIWPQPPFHGYGYRKGQRFYFLNLLEELDTPGEWFLDRATGLLYFWPPWDLAKAEVFFPELQKPMLRLKNTEHVSVRGITFECSRSQAIIVEGGSHNEVAGCTVRNFGAECAISISGTESGIRSCDVYELAGTGVSLQGGDRKTLTRANNYAVNDDVHHVGQVFRTYHGAIQLGGVGNRVAHCSIHDVPHQGIGYGGNDHVIEYCEFTRIAQETGDVGVTYAAMDWTFLGHEFRYNYFHNIHGPGSLGCFTIYPDLPCGGIHLYGNVFYDVDQIFHTNSGRGMVIENNLFLHCRGMSFSTWSDAKMFQEGGPWRMVENLNAVNYDQPPYSTRYPVLQRLAEDFKGGTDQIVKRAIPRDNVIRGNVSWGSWFLRLGGPKVSLEDFKVEKNLIADEIVFTGSLDGKSKAASYRNGEATVAEAFGERGNILVKDDPGFGDLLTQDFRLSADSPASKLGFKPIPFEKIGLQVDALRKTIPTIVYDPQILPASRTFLNKLVIRIMPTPTAGGPKCLLRYTLDGKEPTSRSAIYKKPIRITDTATLKVAAFVKSGKRLITSNTVSATYTGTRLGRGGVYLSDLKEYDLSVYMPCWKKDTNYLGTPIRLGGVEYAKGLLLHPTETADGKGRASVVYRLDGELDKAKRFKAVIGIDDAMSTYNKGSATFIVEAHRAGNWVCIFESGHLKLGDKPQEVDVDIAGVDQLRLISTDAGDGISCDHATWAMARLE